MAVEIEHGPVLACPYASCGASFPMVPGLTLHLVEEHRRPHGEAFFEASRIQEKALRAAERAAPTVTTTPAVAPAPEPAAGPERLNGKAPRAARRHVDAVVKYSPSPETSARATPPQKEESMAKLPPGAPRQRAPVTCSRCGETGHNALGCTGAKKKATRAPTGGGTRSKPAAKPVTPPEAAAMTNGDLVDHVRRLVADVMRGQAAERELAEIRKLVG